MIRHHNTSDTIPGKRIEPNHHKHACGYCGKPKQERGFCSVECHNDARALGWIQ